MQQNVGSDRFRKQILSRCSRALGWSNYLRGGEGGQVGGYIRCNRQDT